MKGFKSVHMSIYAIILNLDEDENQTLYKLLSEHFIDNANDVTEWKHMKTVTRSSAYIPGVATPTMQFCMGGYEIALKYSCLILIGRPVAPDRPLVFQTDASTLSLL